MDVTFSEPETAIETPKARGNKVFSDEREGSAQQNDVLFLHEIPSNGTFQLFENLIGTCEIIEERSIPQCKFLGCPSYTQDEPGWYALPARAQHGKSQEMPIEAK
ncbi:hypothetical protein TNCV_3200381 [Trichonephila clavipes]|nr:hypothetical protein TNCV_3200381 [Trichonephila clavipes]